MENVCESIQIRLTYLNFYIIIIPVGIHLNLVDKLLQSISILHYILASLSYLRNTSLSLWLSKLWRRENLRMNTDLHIYCIRYSLTNKVGTFHGSGQNKNRSNINFCDQINTQPMRFLLNKVVVTTSENYRSSIE